MGWDDGTGWLGNIAQNRIMFCLWILAEDGPKVRGGSGGGEYVCFISPMHNSFKHDATQTIKWNRYLCFDPSSPCSEVVRTDPVLFRFRVSPKPSTNQTKRLDEGIARFSASLLSPLCTVWDMRRAAEPSSVSSVQNLE